MLFFFSLFYSNNFYLEQRYQEERAQAFRGFTLASQVQAQEGETVVPPVPLSHAVTVQVPVLMYHYVQEASDRDSLTQDLSVSPEHLEEQASYLANNGYSTISPEQLYQALVFGQPLPPKSVLLTFDDGYRDFYTQAYPILSKHHLKATVFVVTGLLDRYQYLRSEEVVALSQDAQVTIASHTLYHPDLKTLRADLAWGEISEGKQVLEKLIAKKVDYFAYPFGAFNEQTVVMVQDSGFKMAFTTQYGQTHQTESLLLSPRVRISGYDSLSDFGHKLNH